MTQRFSLDCCDRQAIAFAAITAGISGELIRDVMVQTLVERFGPATELPESAEWLSDNESGYIAHETQAFARDICLISATDAISLTTEQRHGRVVREGL